MTWQESNAVSSSQAKVTVVIPAYRADRTLGDVLDALSPQLGPGRCAVLVRSAEPQDEREPMDAWPWIEVLDLPQRTLPGRSRNVGMANSSSELVAFLDADAVPEPGWLDELERAMHAEVDAVASAVVNGTPDSRVGTAGYLLEFVDWSPESSRPPKHAPSCGLLVRKAALERIGGFPEDLWPGEDTMLTWRLEEDGRLGFAPRSQVRHLNRRRVSEYMIHARRLGTAYREVCARLDPPNSWLGRPPWAVLALFGRLAVLGMKVTRRRGSFADVVGLAPLLVLGTLCWAVGIVWPARVRLVSSCRSDNADTLPVTIGVSAVERRHG